MPQTLLYWSGVEGLYNNLRRGLLWWGLKTHPWEETFCGWCSWLVLQILCAGEEYLETRQQEGSTREPPSNTTQSGTKPSLWVTELLQINDNLCFPEGSQLSVGSSPTRLGSHPTICLGTASWTRHLPRFCLFGNTDGEESLMALWAVCSVLHLGTSRSSSSLSLTQRVSPCFT